MTCHAIGGAGGKVGPDLTSIGASAPPDYLVESLFSPNAKIKEGYYSTTITTRDDQEFIGIVANENDHEVILRNAANQELSIVKSDISQRVVGGSLMPSGLMDALLPEERLDLIKFLSVLGKPGEYDAARGGVARIWKIYNLSNPQSGIQSIIQGDLMGAGWITVCSRVNGSLSRENCETAVASRDESRGFFAATQFQSAKGGRAQFDLSGEAKAVWVNGQPVKPGASLNVELNSGLNTLILQLDGAKPLDAVKLSSGDVLFLTN
jgi:putative heme-binding domain-containing protein